MKFKSKRMTIMVTSLAIVFGGIIAFHLVKSFLIKRFFANFEAPAVTVSSVKAEKRDWEPRISAVGNFVAINGVDVNSQASGNVTKIHFESGQYIAKDSPLIDIDDSVEQAMLKFNQADMALKEISFQRQTDLLKRNATSSSSVDEAKANLQQAQANVEKIRAEITQKHITAPFSGELGIRQVNLGQFISPGQTSIVSLQSLDPMFLEFNLPEQLLKQIHINQGILFTVEAFPNILFEGKISAINSKVDPNTHNILVQASLPNCPSIKMDELLKSPLVKQRKEKDGDRIIVSCNTELNTKSKIDQFIFIPGMFTDISVEQPSIPNVVVLPSTSISYSLYGDSVYVIEPNKDGKKDENGKVILNVRRVFVNTGDQEGNFTVIESGIQPGQDVVSSGELKLQNGARVVINNDIKLNSVSNPDSLGE